MLSSNIIIIPLYQQIPNNWESFSFEQCCKIFHKHPICIVTHSRVDISIYQNIALKKGIKIIKEDFDKSFFTNIKGYNLLMLDKTFYKRFAEYQYMLIYQLDAWVFRDELDEWCAKGYDYIGAPWVEKDNEGNLTLTCVGNGGFSLRRVKHFIDVLTYKGPVRKASQLNLPPSLKNNIYKLFYSLGYQNTIEYYKKDPTLYEDIFLSIFLSNTKLRAKMPRPEEASLFAFEKHPSFLFSKNGKLPFGCHAWRKYEYESFWVNYIKYHS